MENVKKIHVENVQQNQGELCSINVVNERMLVGSKEHPVNKDQMTSLDVKPDVSGMEKRNHSNVKYANNYSQSLEERNLLNVKYANNYSQSLEERNLLNVKYVNNDSKSLEPSNVSGMEKRNHSNVKYVNNYSLPTEFDSAAQKLNSECLDQEVSGMDDVTTEGQKPTRHPGGISDTVTLQQVLDDKQLFEYLLEKLNINDNEILKTNPRLMKKVKRMIYKHKETFLSPNSQLVGSTSLVEMGIDLPPGTRPYIQLHIRYIQICY